uniref:Centrosomin N-terminal motif 1 domain-containing protein n=1 Tax=Poecilia reticulata TaxID=8081 RepID=A0A3P9N404_POERE
MFFKCLKLLLLICDCVTLQTGPFLCRSNRTRHLNDLKKENFSLKLRIYFLEEKIQQKFDQSGDGIRGE